MFNTEIVSMNFRYTQSLKLKFELVRKMADMKKQILEELQTFERSHNCQVILAVESGSRSWGFASEDSENQEFKFVLE